MSSAEEPATLAQPPQAIPLAVVPKNTDTDPVQPSPEGAILQGAKADSIPPSQDVADAEGATLLAPFVFSLTINLFLFHFENFVIYW